MKELRTVFPVRSFVLLNGSVSVQRTALTLSLSKDILMLLSLSDKFHS